jgi:VanZ family protein
MNRRIALALGWAWVALIVYLSLMHDPPRIEVHGGDKAGHVLLYGVAAFWFCAAYTGKARVLHCLGLVALGVGLEFVQRWVGYRSFEIADMVADVIGVLAGWAVVRVIPVRFPRA